MEQFFCRIITAEPIFGTHDNVIVGIRKNGIYVIGNQRAVVSVVVGESSLFRVVYQ